MDRGKRGMINIPINTTTAGAAWNANGNLQAKLLLPSMKYVLKPIQALRE
jgi:hypothetical protein